MSASCPPAGKALRLRVSDIRGLARLAVDGCIGVADVVESMHHTIASRTLPLGRPPAGRPGGITGLVYGSVRGTARLAGLGVDALLRSLPAGDAPSTAGREALVAALNGVWGDHLEASGNPLAIPMALRIGSGIRTPRVLILVHGLCMNPRQWNRGGHDHGESLARDRGLTPAYVHYNSGRRVGENGRELARHLQDLVERWPVPVEELVIVGHSMGGLVARGACIAGAGQPWMRLLSRMVFLGTPHHGAPLERIGQAVDTLLGVSPYAAPLARLTRARSAGIADLRSGCVRDEDGRSCARRPAPLPPGVRCYAVAATTASRPGASLRAALGDGLVPLASALGDHRDPGLSLRIPRRHRFVLAGANHWDLLGRAEVYEKLRAWVG